MPSSVNVAKLAHHNDSTNRKPNLLQISSSVSLPVNLVYIVYNVQDRFILRPSGKESSSPLRPLAPPPFGLVVNKKFQKSLFRKKKLFTEHEFEKCCEAKKMHKGHITGRKNFNQKNQN